jgi:predicted DNA-binding helix-hairpin-helix protein
LQDLRRLRVALKRAKPFIVTADHNPAVSMLDSELLKVRTQTVERQLMLFEASGAVITGEF